jgi:hypothetical protein
VAYIDPKTGQVVLEKDDKFETPEVPPTIENKEDVDNTLYGASGEVLLSPDSEGNQEISQITAGMAGIASGLIKVPEGIVSLGAELMDLGLGTQYAAEVEKFFDKINPFEEIAEQKALGKITQALTQIGVPAGIGAKVATKLATKALKAKRAGRYLNVKSANLQKGVKKAAELNNLSTKQKFAAVTLGGAAGETMVANVEDIGTIGDAFEAGPTELDRDVEADPRADAERKLLNRLKFGSESLLLTPIVYGAGVGIKSLATRGKELAYSNKAIEKTFDKVGSWFRPRGSRPQELFRAQRTETGRTMADTNFAMEQVKRIDQEVDKMFPEVKTFLNKTTEDSRAVFLKEINDLMFEGDLAKDIPKQALQKFLKLTNKLKAEPESVQNILGSIGNVRRKFTELLDITEQGPVGIIPAGTKKKLQTDLRSLMGDRVKNYIGTTYRIFQNQDYGFYTRYKPTEQSVNKVKEIFKRYAANVLKQAKKYNPKSKLPTFAYDNLSAGASTPDNIKTFARTLERELPDGTKELKVIGKGSKAFRELFGEIEDARYSIFEGIGRLGTIARKNQLFDEILDADEALKAAATKETAAGSRGFFFSSPLEARRALPNQEIVKIDPYVQEFFKDGVLINRLQGMYTTKDIAEAFGNSSRVSQWMRGEAGNAFTRTGSWLYRNLYLTPKAGSQYAKTILSVPTHFRNFLSSAGFAIGNGALTNPIALYNGMKKAKDSLQLGLRDPKAMDYYRELLELGVVNSNVRMGDLTNLMRDAKVFESGNIATDSILKPMIKSLGKAGEAAKRTVRKAASVMQDAYVAEDDFWKIALYETELARRTAAYGKAGIKKTLPELKEEAARIIRNTVPNYAYVGDFVRGMRATPFGNFMSWPSEVFRTGYGIAEQALKDIKDPITGSLNYFKSTNPMKGVGLARLTGAVTAFGALPYGIIEGTKAIYGVSDDEAKAVRESAAAPWSKNSQLIVIKDPETGQFSYSDWSHNNVYDTLTRPFMTLLRNVQNGIDNEEVLIKGFVDGLTQAAAETANPFIGESIFTEAVNDIIFRKGRTAEGYELFTENTPRVEQWSRALKHVVATQAPQYKQLLKVYNSTTGQPDDNGDVIEIPDALAGVFGFRLIPVEPEKALGFHINDYQRGIRESRKEFTGGQEGVLKPMKTPNDVIERYFVANQQLFKNAQQMYRHIDNIRKLNVNPAKIAETFVERGMKRDYGELTSGIFSDAYYPSKKAIELFEKISRETGQPNPWRAAEPIIANMYNAFLNQRLNSEFNLKLEDFLPQSTTAPEQSALPEQPMPNVQIVQPQQVSMLQNGLTPVESALLSDEEKSIRLRQRGLA